MSLRRTRGGARWQLATICASVLLASFGTSSVSVALPSLAEEFEAPFVSVQWVMLAYLLATTSSILSVGALMDLVGRRRMLLAGITAYTTATLACSVSPGLQFLIVARAGQGLGAATLLTVSIASVGGAAPGNGQGRAMGFLAASSAIGTALGPAVGGLLIGSLGWSFSFWFQVPVGLLCLALAMNCPGDEPAPTTRRFDVMGTVLLATTLVLFTLATTVGDGRLDRGGILLGASFVALAAFIGFERRTPCALLELNMFQHPLLRARLLAANLVATVVMATLLVGPFHLTRALGLRPAMVGVVMAVGPLSAAVMGVPAGYLVDRFSAHRMSIVGLMGLIAGCGVLVATPQSAGVGGYAVPIAAMTGSYALFQVANNTATMAHATGGAPGAVSGALNLSRHIGLVAGSSMMGAVFVLGTGAHDLSAASAPAVVAGMRLTFLVGAGLVAVAMLALLYARRVAR